MLFLLKRAIKSYRTLNERIEEFQWGDQCLAGGEAWGHGISCTE